VPTPYPKEFRDDVIAVARKGDQSIAQVAKSFGISESCLHRWVHIAERDEARGTERVPAKAAASSESDLAAENNELRKLAKKLEQENEILRRATAYFARDVLPK
jgi:transposase-like protein